ncbi:MAG: hypothetical protein AB2A00_10230 [Myxococcota bacterium]
MHVPMQVIYEGLMAGHDEVEAALRRWRPPAEAVGHMELIRVHIRPAGACWGVTAEAVLVGSGHTIRHVEHAETDARLGLALERALDGLVGHRREHVVAPAPATPPPA